MSSQLGKTEDKNITLLAEIENRLDILLTCGNRTPFIEILEDPEYREVLARRFPEYQTEDLLQILTTPEEMSKYLPTLFHAAPIVLFAAGRQLSPHGYFTPPVSKHSRLTFLYAAKGDIRCEAEGISHVLPQGNAAVYTGALPFQALEEQGMAIACVIQEQYHMDVLLGRMPRNSFSRWLCPRHVSPEVKERYLQIDCSESQRIPFFVQNALDYYVESYLRNYEVINSYILLTFTELSNYYVGAQNVAESENNSPLENDMLLMPKIIEYIQAHSDSVTLNSAAEHFHYNPHYLSNLIKALSGKTFTDLLQSIRMERAIVLLECSKLSVNEIVEQVGYRNVRFFYNKFQEKYGCTPAAYRKNHKKSCCI